jgi:uncharacterized protein YjbJ (UPF0337 family)
LKGKLKEIAGKLGMNSELEAEGKDEKIASKVQEKIDQVKKVLGSSESGVSCMHRLVHEPPATVA